MRRLVNSLCLGLALMLVGLVHHGVAADLPQFQPCWRGAAGSTFQAWGFTATPTNVDEFGGYYGPQTDLPDAGWNNPYGTPQAVIVPEFGGVGWFSSDSGFSATLSGIWDLGYGGGSVSLAIPNAAGSAGLTRDIVVQVTEATTVDITMTNIVTVAGGTQVGSVQKVTLEAHPNYTWIVSQWVFRVPANSAPNLVTITGGCQGCNSSLGGENSFVDSVVVDTRLPDFSTLSPGGNLNVASLSECSELTLNPGAVYTWEMKDAAGAAGTGFDQVAVSGNSNATVLASSANKFVVNLISLNGAAAGPAANFDKNVASSWSLISVAGGSIAGFDPSKFLLNSGPSQFQNDLAGGTFSIAQSVNGKAINLLFNPNHAPVATDATFTRGTGLPLKIKIADLIAGFTSDPDGDGRALSSVASTSSQGGTVSSDGTYIYYESPNDNADFFTYAVRDLNTAYRAGDTVRTASAKVNVNAVNPGGTVQTINTSGGSVTVNCAGIPGTDYDVQRSATVAFTTFVVVLSTNAPANGVFTFTDPNPPQPTAFYRLMKH
ncbi:MAG: hypothetical protein JWM16_2941 [Verrucomicrobiales bacterium]|nr:hypothetical protein [Verrucomicrobiales bacterium]